MYDYIYEYQRLVYDYYSKNAVAYMVTYYNLDPENSTWDDENLLGGSYERVGNLSGTKWTKMLTLPVFYIEEIATLFDAQDVGYYKEGNTTVVVPSSYGFTPYPGDLVKMDQSYMRPNDNTYPIFIVTGIEKSANTARTFWKLNLKIRESITTEHIESQVSNTKMFMDYDKQIHTLDEATIIAQSLVKNEKLSEDMKAMFDQNSGLYFLS